MVIEAQTLLRSLALPPESVVSEEPLGERRGSPLRVRIDVPGGAPQVVVVRQPTDPEAAFNHAAVMEALARAGFTQMPRLLAVLEGATVEEWVDGASALAFVPPPGSMGAAIEALARLHGLPIQEGLRWGSSPEEVLPSPDVPLHRLGFAAAERDPAKAPLEAAHVAMLETPFGFVHGDATAARFLLAPGAATLINFGHAGFGPQLFDVAALLLTSGLEPAARRVLAQRYAGLRSMATDATADLVDLAGLLWGFETQLGLARRLVETLGDDAESAALNTAATRIEQGIRNAAGSHAAAAAIRSALWAS